MRGIRWRKGLWLAVGAALLLPHGAVAQAPTGPLVVYSAGSLALPVQELFRAFARQYPNVRAVQEPSGSLEAARKLTELGKIPDLVALADQQVIPALLIPRYTDWYIAFARNALVLAHHSRAPGAAEIGPDNWPEILLRRGVRIGRSDPALDPGGYRALFAYQLIAAHRGRPGLGDSLLAASPARFVRSKSAELVALLQAGEIDYAWIYRSSAEAAGLPYASVGPEIDLSDPARAAWYDRAVVRLPGPRIDGDSITVRGEPIVFALSIPAAAPNRPAAEAFARFMLSAEGRAILQRTGFLPLDPPIAAGPGRPPASVFP